MLSCSSRNISEEIIASLTQKSCLHLILLISPVPGTVLLIVHYSHYSVNPHRTLYNKYYLTYVSDENTSMSHEAQVSYMTKMQSILLCFIPRVGSKEMKVVPDEGGGAGETNLCQVVEMC